MAYFYVQIYKLMSIRSVVNHHIWNDELTFLMIPYNVLLNVHPQTEQNARDELEKWQQQIQDLHDKCQAALYVLLEFKGQTWLLSFFTWKNLTED